MTASLKLENASLWMWMFRGRDGVKAKYADANRLFYHRTIEELRRRLLKRDGAGAKGQHPCAPKKR